MVPIKMPSKRHVVLYVTRLTNLILINAAHLAPPFMYVPCSFSTCDLASFIRNVIITNASLFSDRDYRF